MTSQPPKPGDAIAHAAAQTQSDDPGKLIREDYQRKLEFVWRQPDNCPVCDSSAWSVGDLVDAPLRGVAGLPDPPSIGGLQRQVYIYVPVTCLYCGYTMFFHSGVLDVRDEETVKAEPPLRLPPESQSS